MLSHAPLIAREINMDCTGPVLRASIRKFGLIGRISSQKLKQSLTTSMSTSATFLCVRLILSVLETAIKTHRIPVWAAECDVFLTRPKDANWEEIPSTLYYHINPRSSVRYEAEGFCSANKKPDDRAWQEQLKGRGFYVLFVSEHACFSICTSIRQILIK